jgi:uncharacterized protein YaaR (DUF327 family)
LRASIISVSITNMMKETLKQSKKGKKTKKVQYKSPLRDEQAKLTESKIQNAVFEIFKDGGAIENITYKAVAQKASVTEMITFAEISLGKNQSSTGPQFDNA